LPNHSSKKVTKTMIYPFGSELEFANLTASVAARGFIQRGIKGFKFVLDQSHGVTGECVSCPMAYGLEAINQIQKACEALEDMGATIIVNCGFHVHVSNAPLQAGIDPDEWTAKSINHFESTGGYYNGDLCEPMDAVLVKDIMWRYTRMQSTHNGINSMLPISRRNMSMAQALLLPKIEAANTIDELRRATHGKFSTINLMPWTTHGTIEFRQAAGTLDAVKVTQWVRFIMNLIDHSQTNRITNTGTRTIDHTTPDQPFRRGARVGVQYTMMRSVQGGATTRDIMDATGCSESRVRAAVSEIRTRVGDANVTTHTMQAQGATYGDGTDMTRYEVRREWQETITGGAALLPDTRIGNPSIWASLDDSDYEFWMGRIQSLDR